MTRRKEIQAGAPFVELLTPIFRQGKLVYQSPSIHAIREHARKQLEGFHAGVKRFLNPHQYPVGLELGLHELRTDLILKARGIKT
jgi:nicotinate phosphoribosyltransferase